jgi:dihydropyrimidinase
MKYLIKNGIVCFEDGLKKSDILIDNGKIISFDNNYTISPENIIDASDCYVLPGMIDIHTHLDDKIGKYYLADTYITGSEIAIKNGITTLFTFITQPVDDSLKNSINTAIGKSRNKSYCDYMWHLTPVSFDDSDWDYIYSLIKKGFKTFKFYTTYKSSGIYCDYEHLENIFFRLKDYNVTILIHCEDNDIIEKNSKRKLNLKDSYSHALFRPKKSEFVAIEKVIKLSKKFNIKIHIVHVSTSEGAELINKARKNISITCETAPHYLNLSDDYLRREDGYKWICSPPLRDGLNVNELKRKAIEGYFDILATDHCAFLKKDKSNVESKKDIRLVPCGVAGLGSLPHLTFNLYKDKFDNAIMQMCKRLSENPAKITGIYPRKGTIKIGSDADIVILSIDKEQHNIQSSLSDVYETYIDFKTNLNFKYVFLRGDLMVKDNSLISLNNFYGKCLINI